MNQAHGAQDARKNVTAKIMQHATSKLADVNVQQDGMVLGVNIVSMI